VNNFGDIVVGYDGSKGSKRAVEFAAAEAAAHDARLRIVTAWSSKAPAAAAMSPLVVPCIAHDRARIAEARLEEAVALARDIAPDIEIKTVAVEGGAAAELTRASENSRLLVVGCRGHGGVQGLLLGSVSHHCALHARCPVLVVPAVVDDRPPARHPAQAPAAH
jgi:nucleotide-binding universal stress UspA family protein